MKASPQPPSATIYHGWASQELNGSSLGALVSVGAWQSFQGEEG